MSEPNPNPEPTPTPTPPADVVTMTKAEYEAAITQRIGAALAQAEKKRANVPAEAVKELEELRAEKAERARQELERKGEYQKALDAQREAIAAKYEPEIKARDEKIAAREDRLRKEVVTNQILAAASNGNAINAEQVVKLLGGQVRLSEEFEPQVVDDNGNPRFAQDGKPMTPAQLVDDFLKGNPHFVKASGKPGQATGGAHKSGAGNDLSPIAAKEKEVADLAERVLSGSLDAVAKHNKAVQELKKLRTA